MELIRRAGPFLNAGPNRQMPHNDDDGQPRLDLLALLPTAMSKLSEANPTATAVTMIGFNGSIESGKTGEEEGRSCR